MEIKLFSLIKDDDEALADNKRVIAECARAFTPDEMKFRNYASGKRMLIAAAQSLRSADVVILSVRISSYNSFKKMLCSAFSLPTEQNQEILSALQSKSGKAKLTETVLENNSLFPKEADIFPVSDLRCCGFAVRAGSQSVVVLPLDSIKTSEVVYGSLYEYLAECAGVTDKKEVSKLKIKKLNKRLVFLLRKGNLNMACAPLGGVKLMEESLEKADSEHKNMFISDYKPAPRQLSESVGDYIISVAQKTRETAQSDFACAVSSAFVGNSDNSTFIYYAIADSDKTFVTKLYSKEGETPQDLYNAGVEGAFMSAVTKVNEYLIRKKSEIKKEDKLLRQKEALIAAACVACCTAISTLLALFLS